MAEGARLESVYTATYRGFESPPHRHILRRARTKVRAFFSHVALAGGMRTPDRGSTTGPASWTDRARSKRAAPQGRAKRVNPPLTAIFEMRARTKVRAFFRMWHRRPSRGRHKCLARATHPTGRTTSSPSRRSAAGKCCKNNKARDIPGFAHSLAFSNRLSTFAGKALNARSHRW